jgi:hypothetical protein
VSLLPFLTRPPEVVLGHYRDWLDHLLATSSERWPGFRDAWTVWSLVRDALAGRPGPMDLKAPVDSNAYRLVQMLTAGAALLWCLWQARRGVERRWLVNVTLAMGCAWLMLFGPAVEWPTYVFLAPSLAWAFLERGAWPAGRALAWSAALLVLLLGWGSLTRPYIASVPSLLAALPAGTALFVCWLVGYAHCGPQRPSSSPRNVLIRRQASVTSLAGPGSSPGAGLRKPLSQSA